MHGCSTRASHSKVCEQARESLGVRGSVALDRVRVSSWSELAPRIPLKRIQLGRLGRGSQDIQSIHSSTS